MVLAIVAWYGNILWEDHWSTSWQGVLCGQIERLQCLHRLETDILDWFKKTSQNLQKYAKFSLNIIDKSKRCIRNEPVCRKNNSWILRIWMWKCSIASELARSLSMIRWVPDLRLLSKLFFRYYCIITPQMSRKILNLTKEAEKLPFKKGTDCPSIRKTHLDHDALNISKYFVA